MNDYVPFSNPVEHVSPHDVQPLRRDPWFVWAIAASPVGVLAAFIALASAGGWVGIVMAALSIVAISFACRLLAQYDQRAIADLGSRRPTSPDLALLPSIYLLVRAARRVSGPHRGNPLHPVVLNLLAGFAPGYYLVLVLMGVAGIVNRGSF